MKIILGAGNTSYEGWVSTQESELNLLDYEDFKRQFEEYNIDAMLAEPVWEHNRTRRTLSSQKLLSLLEIWRLY